MKHKFFGKDAPSPELNEHLIIHILNLLDPDTLDKAARVSKDWNKWVTLCKKYVALLPTIHQIPFLKGVGLDVLRLKTLKNGMTNDNFTLKHSKERWALRNPGKGSSVFINRADEAHNAHQAEELGLNAPISYFNPVNGLQLTRYIKGSRPLFENTLARSEILKKIAASLYKLNTSAPFLNEAHIFERNEELVKSLITQNFCFPGDISFIEIEMARLKKLVSSYKIDSRPCHNDPTPSNWLATDDGLYLIDWEYSSNNDIIWDLAYFAVEAKLPAEEELDLLVFYFGEDQVTPLILAWFELYKPIAEWWISIWSWTQVVNKADAAARDAYIKLGEMSYKTTITFLKSKEYQDALNLIEEEQADPSFSGIRNF